MTSSVAVALAVVALALALGFFVLLVPFCLLRLPEGLPLAALLPVLLAVLRVIAVVGETLC